MSLNNSNKFRNRPQSSNDQGIKKTLGSVCPVIIKHEFPNESKEYIDDVLQQMSSTQKRFRYNRPMTAKSKLSTKKMSFQNQTLGSSTSNWRPQTAAAATGGGHSNLENLTSAELYKKLLSNKGQTNEKRFQIKPQKKLNTFSIHSALYKVKKQKEYLDQKIQELEDRKTNFNQTDFYLIANAGAMEYIFNMQDTQQSQQDQVSQIMNKSKPISEKKSSVPSSRPFSGKPKKKKPEYLKPDDDEDEEEGSNMEFNIIGNVSKLFKQIERQGINTWGDKEEKPQESISHRQQSIKNKIEDITKNQSNIQLLMQSIENDYDNSEEKINEVNEEHQEHEEEYEQQQQQQQQQQLQQQNFIQSQTVGFPQSNSNNYYLNNQKKRSLQLPPRNEFSQFTQMSNTNQQQGPPSPQLPYNNLKTSQNSQRFNNTFSNNFRPESAHPATTTSQQGFQNKVNARPQTAKNTPLHALMSFGQPNKVKNTIPRNFDHLELIRQQKEEKYNKHLKKQSKNRFKRQQNSLSINGQGIDNFGDTFKQQRVVNSAQISRALGVPQSAKYRTQYKIDSKFLAEQGLENINDQEELNHNYIKQQQMLYDEMRMNNEQMYLDQQQLQQQQSQQFQSEQQSQQQ